MAEETTNQEGVLVKLIHASSNELKQTIANQAISGAHGLFKQKVDAVWTKINQNKIRQVNLTNTLIPKTTVDIVYEVNVSDFVDKDLEILKEMTNDEIWLGKLKDEYKRLFGKDYVEPETFLK